MNRHIIQSALAIALLAAPSIAQNYAYVDTLSNLGDPDYSPRVSMDSQGNVISFRRLYHINNSSNNSSLITFGSVLPTSAGNEAFALRAQISTTQQASRVFVEGSDALVQIGGSMVTDAIYYSVPPVGPPIATNLATLASGGPACEAPTAEFGASFDVTTISGTKYLFVGDPLASHLTAPNGSCVEHGCVYIFDITNPNAVTLTQRLRSPQFGSTMVGGWFGQSLTVVEDPTGPVTLLVGLRGTSLGGGTYPSGYVAGFSLTNGGIPFASPGAASISPPSGTTDNFSGSLLSSGTSVSVGQPFNSAGSPNRQVLAIGDYDPVTGLASYSALPTTNLAGSAPGVDSASTNPANALVVMARRNAPGDDHMVVLRLVAGNWVEQRGPVCGSLGAPIFDRGGVPYALIDSGLTVGEFVNGPEIQSSIMSGAVESFGGSEVDLNCFDQNSSNTTGASGLLTATGLPLLATNNVVLAASQLPPNVVGYFMVSDMTGFIANPGGSFGNLCLSGSVGRYLGPGQVMNSGPLGAFSLGIDLGAIPVPSGPVAAIPGDTWHFQGWHRDQDANGNPGSNMTHSISIFVQ